MPDPSRSGRERQSRSGAAAGRGTARRAGPVGTSRSTTRRSSANCRARATRCPCSSTTTKFIDRCGGSTSGRFPVDLYEDKDNTYVRAELPGFNRSDINVEMVDGYLTISAVRKTAAPTTEGEAQPEDSFTLTRSVSINDEVQTDKVSAAYENGVLTVTLPKREETKPRKVTVAVK